MISARSTSTLTSLLLRLWRHLSKRRRRQFLALLGLMLLGAFAEIVSLGAVLPFIGVLAAPDVVFEQKIVREFARARGIESAEQLMLPLTVAFCVAAAAAAMLRMLLVWANTRFTFAAGRELSLEIYRRTLYQPYHVHVSRSSSEVISGIAGKIGATMLGVLLPSLVLVSSVILLLAVVFTLLAIDPLIACTAAAVFGASYSVATLLTNRSLRRNGQVIAAAHTDVIKALQEGLGGIRDVLLDGTQAAYCDIYRRADQVLRRAQGTNVFIAQSPKPPIEAIGMVFIAAIAYGMSRRYGGLAAALPTLAALALGAQRLLPALQSTYASWASIAGTQGVLADTLDLLDQPLPQELLRPAPPPLTLKREIRFRDVRFRYTDDGPWALEGLSVSILRGARIGIVGGTGGGKSTAMDLLMGLLAPTSGEILIDGTELRGNVIRAWQRTIAHVPQSIYLADATLAENIAFGVSSDAIDMDRVVRAARYAQIADFIESRPQGYYEVVGERGVRLSGGQRQRIGIARALYKQVSVLVLDEATSALDNVTERSVMESIEALEGELTIIVVAHRLTTVRRCDSIVQIERGRVSAQGTYEQLLASSVSFQQMVHAGAF